MIMLGTGSVDAGVDYCQYTCSNGQKNVGCNNDFVNSDKKIKSHLMKINNFSSSLSR